MNYILGSRVYRSTKCVFIVEFIVLYLVPTHEIIVKFCKYRLYDLHC